MCRLLIAISWLFFAACFVSCCCVPMDTTHSPSASSSRSSHFKAGDVVELDNGIEQLLVASDNATFDRLVTLSTAKDETGVRQMVARGEAFVIDSGTQAKVISQGWLSSEVRLLDGVHNGRSVIVDNEFIKDE